MHSRKSAIHKLCPIWAPLILASLFALPASAQSFRVQCPTATTLHPKPPSGQTDPLSGDPLYSGPTVLKPTLKPSPARRLSVFRTSPTVRH